MSISFHSYSSTVLAYAACLFVTLWLVARLWRTSISVTPENARVSAAVHFVNRLLLLATVPVLAGWLIFILPGVIGKSEEIGSSFYFLLSQFMWSFPSAIFTAGIMIFRSDDYSLIRYVRNATVVILVTFLAWWVSGISIFQYLFGASAQLIGGIMPLSVGASPKVMSFDLLPNGVSGPDWLAYVDFSRFMTLSAIAVLLVLIARARSHRYR